jgi:alkylhydroperoxidase family enzyme
LQTAGVGCAGAPARLDRLAAGGAAPVEGAEMSWIRVVDEGEAEGRLAELYGRLVEPWGGVDNVLKIHSLNPPSLLAHFELYRTLMRGASPLTRVQREMIAVVVSAANRCHY